MVYKDELFPEGWLSTSDQRSKTSATVFRLRHSIDSKHTTLKLERGKRIDDGENASAVSYTNGHSAKYIGQCANKILGWGVSRRRKYTFVYVSSCRRGGKDGSVDVAELVPLQKWASVD